MTLARNSLVGLAIVLSVLGSIMVLPASVSAQANSLPGQGGNSFSGTGANSQSGITNPLSGINSVSEFFKRLLDAIIMIGIPICVFFIILAGFKFITAQGNQEKLSAARDNFMYTVIGVAIFIGAWALAQLIAATLKGIGVNV